MTLKVTLKVQTRLIQRMYSFFFQVKLDLYKCVAHHYIATLLLTEYVLCDETLESFRYLYCENDNPTVTDIRLPNNEEDRRVLGFCHLRQSLASLEDSVRHARLNRELRGKVGLQSALSSMKDKILATFERKEIRSQEELDRFLDPPQIVGKNPFQYLIA